jgi:biotin carboxylase/biotin carboxyl carrier protein
MAGAWGDFFSLKALPLAVFFAMAFAGALAKMRVRRPPAVQGLELAVSLATQDSMELGLSQAVNQVGGPRTVAPVMTATVPSKTAQSQTTTAGKPGKPVSAPQSEPPFTTVITYNQSKHATNSVLADIRAVWGPRVRVIQTLEDGLQRLPGMDGALPVLKGSWGNMDQFAERLDAMCTQDHELAKDRAEGNVCFMPGWSAFAESSEAAYAAQRLGLVWPGTEPEASVRLEKIQFKRICEKVGAPTPPFRVLTEEDYPREIDTDDARDAAMKLMMDGVAAMNTSEPGLIKSIHGGGGKGTAKLFRPDDEEEVRAACEKVLNEMNRADGIYFEQMVNQKGDGRFFQLELEVDGDVCAHGGRFVWFNSRLQKVVEIGFSDTQVTRFMPRKLYEKSRQWASDIAREAGNNTRATVEGLVFTDESGNCELQFIECNRRPQVENEALALLEQDSDGNRRYTFAELMMRARGYPAPRFRPAQDAEVVLHARWLHGNPDQDGNITYQPGTILGMTGPRMDCVKSELLATGEISFTADAQLGKAVIVGNSWEEVCANAVEYFRLRKPNILGSSSTYAEVLGQLFGLPQMLEGKVASNETFRYIDIPKAPERSVLDIINEQVSPILVKGYRSGEGVDTERWPTTSIVSAAGDLVKRLTQTPPAETAYTRFARGEGSFEDYIQELRQQLERQGGGWVTVAPRDTCQQGNDSESAAISELSRRNCELYGQQAGCVGYEIGGAQYQAGLIRGFDPSMIMRLGLPYNMPAHSLQRSQYVNGLTELTPEIRQPLFEATADVVSDHYRGKARDGVVPWHPYNFHAGNFVNEATGYAPQDETTGELLDAGCVPLPTWVFSAKFTLEALEKWTHRQVDLFEARGRTLHQLRIKNPGQGRDWTAEAVWQHCEVMRKVCKERGLPDPILYIHNHDFNGLGGHIGQELLRTAQAAGYNYLIVDAAYRRNRTHNDNTIVLDALKLTPEQRDNLIEYNYNQEAIEKLLSRFHSRNSHMTPWDSDWAGGTEGSDLRIAKEYDVNPRQINMAKEIANVVFPLERAVTPFSEYKLRLGLGILLEPKIDPKTVDTTKEFIRAGGKLKVGGDVLVGLQRWETLVAKTPEVDMLLANMPGELEAALLQKAKLVTPEDLPEDATASQRLTALGFQQKGLNFILAQPTGKNDLSPLLVAPHVLHAEPRTLPAGTQFEVLVDKDDSHARVQLQFQGFGKAPCGDLELHYLYEGSSLVVKQDDPDAVVSATTSGPRKANPDNANEFACPVPGEVIAYEVEVGDVLKVGAPLCVLESMKMEMKISVPEELDGKEVRSTPCTVRSAASQGDMLMPGNLLLEVAEPKSSPWA